MAEWQTCAWCSGEAAADATVCPDCGAALRMHEAVEVLKIPGVTVLDPGLEAWAAQPVHIPGTSPSQALAGSAVTSAAVGGAGSIVALGALGAVAAAEYLSTGGDGSHHVNPEAVGQLDPYIVDAIERFDRGEEPAPPLPPPAHPGPPHAPASTDPEGMSTED
jgi:hypothetical protein